MVEGEIIAKIEAKKLREMQSICSSLDSPDLKAMYAAGGKMMTYPYGKSLLPKAMSLLDAEDLTIRRLMFRAAARNVYGKYIADMFNSFGNITPAEREQVLQVIEEKFRLEGAPHSSSEQNRWITALEKLGHEHQPTVFGIMAQLGKPGTKWVTKQIKNHVEVISFGTVQNLLAFPEKTRAKLVQLIIQMALERKRELIPYILEILDKKTIRYASRVLKEGNWKERVKVAIAVGRVGISSCTGLVLDLLADSDWRVKQALLENVNIPESKFSAVTKLLEYVVTDSHARVRTAAERLALQLGTIACRDSNIENQQKKLERKFRKQLLKAAKDNPDVDSSWLGIEIGEPAPIPVIDETAEAVVEGVSISELRKEEPKEKPSTLDLLAALKGARDKAKATQASLLDIADKVEETTVTDRFVASLKRLSESLGKEVPIEALRKELIAEGFSEEDFDNTLSTLERDGIVYRSGKGTVSYVDLKV